MNIKEKMTIGKAKKILRGFLAKDCYYETPLYYAIPYTLEYLNNLQQELQRKDNIIDKAIEYIQNEDNHNDCCGYDVVYVDNLLNILEGKENDI